MPFFWRDTRKPKLVKFKCVEVENAEYDDGSHDWTCILSLFKFIDVISWISFN